MEKIMQWQPIETLPDRDKEYLFWMAPNEDEGLFGVYWVGTIDDWIDDDDITHWMPLPEPPKW